MPQEKSSAPLHATVKFKVVSLILLGLGCIAAMGAWQVHSLRVLNYEAQRDTVVSVVEASLAAVAAADAQASTPEAGRQALAMKAIKAIRFKKGEYVFVIDDKGRMVGHPIKPELEGKDMIDFKDPNGLPVFKAMVDAASKPDGGFVNYLWPKPGSDAPVEKVSFVKAYPQWHWIVGTGVYNDKIEAELREKYWAIGAALLLAMAAMGIVGWRAVSAVTDPIGKAIELVEQMRGGDLRGSQHGVGGEIGTLLDTLNRSKAGIGALASEAHAKAASTRAAAEASARRAQSGSESASGLARALDEAARGRDRIRGGRDGARLWRGRPTGPAGHPSSRGRPTPSSKRWSPSSL